MHPNNEIASHSLYSSSQLLANELRLEHTCMCAASYVVFRYRQRLFNYVDHRLHCHSGEGEAERSWDSEANPAQRFASFHRLLLLCLFALKHAHFFVWIHYYETRLMVPQIATRDHLDTLVGALSEHGRTSNKKHCFSERTSRKLFLAFIEK